jgi:hypothetical protein
MAKTSEEKPKSEKIKKEKKIKHTDRSDSIKKTTLTHDWERPMIVNYILYMMAFKKKFVKGSSSEEIY